MFDGKRKEDVGGACLVTDGKKVWSFERKRAVVSQKIGADEGAPSNCKPEGHA